MDWKMGRPHGRKESVGRLVERVLVADAVERDVDHRLRQAVDRRVAVHSGRVDAGEKRDRVQRVARGRRHAVQLIRIERRRHRRRLSVHQLGAAAHRDAFRQLADFQLDADVRRVHQSVCALVASQRCDWSRPSVDRGRCHHDHRIE